MFKLHTLEMQKPIRSNDERVRILESLKGIQVEILSKESYTRFRYYGLARGGVVIIVFWYKYSRTHRICLQISPCTVLGIEEKTALFDVKEDRLLQCLQQVDELLSKYHLCLCDYRITRVDFTQDIRFEKSEMIDIVIRLLKRTGAPRGYKDKVYGDTIYDDSYNIVDREGSEVVVYNKERQCANRYEEQNACVKGVLRVEARIKILEQARQIFIGNIVCFSYLLEARAYAEVKIKNVFVEGFYIKVKKTKEILGVKHRRREESKRQRNKLEKMIELAEGVAVHQSLSKCIKGENALFCYDTTKDILAQFADRRINLVSISAREQATVIPDMLHMLGMKSEAEMRRDNQFLVENNLLDKVPVYELL